MEFTSKQLAAIEGAIGFPANVTVVTNEGRPGDYHEGASITLEADVRGKIQRSQIHLSPYTNVPFRVVAGNLVNSLNAHIMVEQFNSVIW